MLVQVVIDVATILFIYFSLFKLFDTLDFSIQ